MDINSILANEVNKNAVVNTFTKGMNTDTSDSMMPSDQYRLAKNLRLITHDNGSNGELCPIADTEGEDNDFYNVVASTSIRDYGIVITTGKKPETGVIPVSGWCIWRIYGEDIDLIFGPCTDTLGDAVSLVTRYEDDDNVKLYIADGKHPLMMINVADPANVD
jgi:hypothetical protein